MAVILGNRRNRLVEKIGGGFSAAGQALVERKMQERKREQEFQDLIDSVLVKSRAEGNIDIAPESPFARRLGARGTDLTGITPREKSGDQLKQIIDLTTLIKNLSELGISPSGQPMGGEMGGAADGATAPVLGQTRPIPDVRPTKFESTPYGGVRPTTFEPIPTDEERRQQAQEKLEQSPFYQESKAKRTAELFSGQETRKVQRQMLGEAQEASKRIPTGLGGKLSMAWNRMFNPEHPSMEDWQKVKMVLTDAQLMNTAKTKGAISDREMELFARAAANNDIASVKAMQPVFKKLTSFLDSESRAQTKTYQTLYGEDSTGMLFDGMPANGSELPEGATEEDIQFTMQQHGLTREEVLERIR